MVSVALRAVGCAALLFRILSPIRLFTLAGEWVRNRDSLHTHSEAGRGQGSALSVYAVVAKAGRPHNKSALNTGVDGKGHRAKAARTRRVRGGLLLWARRTERVGCLANQGRWIAPALSRRVSPCSRLSLSSHSAGFHSLSRAHVPLPGQPDTPYTQQLHRFEQQRVTSALGLG